MVKLVPTFGVTKEIVPHMRIETDRQCFSQQVWNAVWRFLWVVEHRNTLPQRHIQRSILTILFSLLNQIVMLRRLHRVHLFNLGQRLGCFLGLAFR